jgi:hypothetical protein
MQKRILNDLSKQILADKVIKDAEIMLKLSPKKEFIFENIAV